jgi:hypothetical protein
MVTDDSSLTVSNSTFSGNTAGQRSGGMFNWDFTPTLSNCTFSGNVAGEVLWGEGGGMSNYYYSSSPTVIDCILWGDTPEEIYNQQSSPVVTYADIQGGYAGTGNINADPMFLDPNGPDNIPGNQDDDFHLKPNSPCIDTGRASGAPDTDIEGKPRPLGNGYDMGTYEFLVTALPWVPLLLLHD